MTLLEQFDRIETYKKVAVAVLGLGFWAILAVAIVDDVLEDHSHNLMEITFYMVIFLFGMVLIFPKLALQLIEILPLPPFLRRNGTPSPPADHSDSEPEEDPPL